MQRHNLSVGEASEYVCGGAASLGLEPAQFARMVLDANVRQLVAASGDLAGYANAGRLPSAAGLVPVPRDSGRRTGNLHRPMRYSRKVRRLFYLFASAAMMREGPNRDYYLKKPGAGLRHVQALIALARRRVDVL